MEMIDFNAKKGFLCDMDGVIYHGNHILPGAAEFIHWLQDTAARCTPSARRGCSMRCMTAASP